VPRNFQDPHRNLVTTSTINANEENDDEGNAMNRAGLAGLGVAVFAFAAPAHADVAGIAPFAGTWAGMRQALTIDGSGTGNVTYADFTACPSCSMAGVPRATINFALTSVSGNTASGSITSDSGQGGNSGPVTATLAYQSFGQTIKLSAGKASGLYCAQGVASQCGG
jgi:hypothetical protein